MVGPIFIGVNLKIFYHDVDFEVLEFSIGGDGCSSLWSSNLSTHDKCEGNNLSMGQRTCFFTWMPLTT